jgi:hypothetical protein
MDFEHTIKLLGLVGGLAGGITLVWRLLDVYKAFLHISITIEQLDGPRVKVRTIMENSNSISRKIDAAFLLIGPQFETPRKTVTDLILGAWPDFQLNSDTNIIRTVTLLIIDRQLGSLVNNLGQMIIALPFYYGENSVVEDENLSFEHIIDTSKFPNGIYEVRFYIESIPRLHRLVQAAFEVRKDLVVG